MTVAFYKMKIMFRDKLFLGAMIAIPLFLVYASGHAVRFEEAGVIPIAVVDLDQSEYSNMILERVKQRDGIRLKVTDEKEAVELVENARVEAAYIIKEGFMKSIIKGDGKETIGVIQSPASLSAGLIGEIIAGDVVRLSGNVQAASWVVEEYKKLGLTGEALPDGVIRGRLWQEAWNETDQQWEPSPLMKMEYREMGNGETAGNTGRKGMPVATGASAGMMVMFIMLFVLFHSGWLMEERNNGTLRRLCAGPVALGAAFAGNVAAMFLMCSAMILSFALLGKLIFGIALFKGWLSWLLFACYFLAVIGISTFLSAFLKTPGQIQAGAPLFALISGFLGGCFWNFIEMPQKVKVLARLTPQGWMLEGLNNLLSGSGHLHDVVLQAGVLFAMAVILLTVSYTAISRQVKY